jgi:sterol desaturase/sphingolipid hydroxylase (fatty acid hydroxylase superfamily)
MFEPKTIAAAVALALLWSGEAWAPHFEHFRGGLRDRLRHDARNFAFGIVNAVIAGLLFGGAAAAVAGWAEAEGVGLLRLLVLPAWAEAAVAFIVFDFWVYLWHRANHAIPFLWRFHRMHHSDRELDASTGLRFHTGEICLSAVLRLAILPLLGMTPWQLVLYEAVFLPVVLLHHSNVSLPRWIDRGLLALVVTPAMHRVHHSRIREETDSNYGSVFPWWDRLLGTFRLRDDPRTIPLGLDELDGPEWQGLRGMLSTPAAPGRRTPAPSRERRLARSRAHAGS